MSDRPAPENKNPTVAEFWKSFSAWAELHRSPSTYSEYANWFNQFKDHFKIKNLGDADVHAVEAFKSKLLRARK